MTEQAPNILENKRTYHTFCAFCIPILLLMLLCSWSHWILVAIFETDRLSLFQMKKWTCRKGYCQFTWCQAASFVSHQRWRQLSLQYNICLMPPSPLSLSSMRMKNLFIIFSITSLKPNTFIRFIQQKWIYIQYIH